MPFRARMWSKNSPRAQVRVPSKLLVGRRHGLLVEHHRNNITECEPRYAKCGRSWLFSSECVPVKLVLRILDELPRSTVVWNGHVQPLS